MRRRPPCGTYSGYQAHTRRGEESCEPCREANRAYTSWYRQERPDVLASDRKQAKIRNRALARLAQRHGPEFLTLLSEERAKEPEA